MTEKPLFDVREFARTAQGSLRAELDLVTFDRDPLAADTVLALRLLQTLESATMAQMRDVLVTPTHKDARVTAFLVTWAFEKFWIADALGAVADTGAAAPLPPSSGSGRGGRYERRGPVRRAIEGMTVGSRIVAAHVSAGLVDDWVMVEYYRRLAGADAALIPLVERVIAIKARHTAFFETEARRRLTESVSAQRYTRRHLLRTSFPIGSIHLGADDAAFGHQFFGDVSVPQLAALPGMTSDDARKLKIGFDSRSGGR